MGKESSSHNSESERARKRRIDDRIEVNKELREKTNNLILAIKSNFFNIQKICPCFTLDYFFYKNKTLKEIKNDTHDYSSEKTDYFKELIDKINHYQIAADGESVLKYNVVSCPHFFCVKCIEQKKNNPCIYCENYITVKNIACFANMDNIEVKNAFRHIIYKYNGSNVSKMQYSRFKKILISEAENFLLTNDNIYEKIKKEVKIKKKNEGKKESDKKNIEKKTTLKQKHKAFYNILKINKDYINNICPYCLKNKEGQDVIELSEESIDPSPSENEIKEHLNLIAVQINCERILDLKSVLNFRFKCEHFFHKECKEKVKEKSCFYCKYYINPINLACFYKNWKFNNEEDIWEFTAKFRGKKYKRKIGKYNEYPVLYKEIYYEVRKFLYTYPVILEEYRNKFISLYKLTQEFSQCYHLYKFDYDIDIKINISNEKRKELEKELEKAKIKQKEIEDYEWTKARKEIDEKYERENDDDDSDSNNYVQRSNGGRNSENEDNIGYKLKTCCSGDCSSKKCFSCHKKAERLQPINLYAHKSCHNKENCFVCKKNKKRNADIKICPKCKDKLRGINYDFKCYVCKEKIDKFIK